MQSRSLKQNSNPSYIKIPDLSSYCGERFNLQISRHRKTISSESKQWFFHTDKYSKDKLEAYNGLNAGLLVSVCYPEAGCTQMRVCTDFLTYLFYFDNISDEMDNSSILEASDIVMNSLHHINSFRTSSRIGTMAKDFYKRMEATASPGALHRFLETMEQFFQSVDQQSRDRDAGHIVDPESYISLRRDTSGCKSCFAMIEYCRNLNIPDNVFEHPVIRRLEDATNDLVSWSNDIFSFRREYAKGDTHNMVSVAMHHYGLNLQDAVDHVAELCRKAIDDFCLQRDNLPSWNPKVDREVGLYVDGLASWIVGILYWSFETGRYFGKDAKTIKQSWIVHLGSV